MTGPVIEVVSGKRKLRGDGMSEDLGRARIIY